MMTRQLRDNILDEVTWLYSKDDSNSKLYLAKLKIILKRLKKPYSPKRQGSEYFPSSSGKNPAFTSYFSISFFDPKLFSFAKAMETAVLLRRNYSDREYFCEAIPVVLLDLRSRIIAQDAKLTYKLVSKVRKVTKKTLITKLSPNVTDIAEIAKMAEDAGSDAVSLVNTFIGMAVDIETKRPKLGAVIGGLSGPAIKPIALRMVWEVFNKVRIPIIGIGGIMDYKDVIEFIICGATAVGVGTANFINPKVTIEIIGGIKEYLQNNKIGDIKELIGSLKSKVAT